MLTSTQCARRWRDCNPEDASFFLENRLQDTWRTGNFELLSKAHTLGGIMDLTFEIVNSGYAASYGSVGAQVQVLICFEGLSVRVGM